VAQGVALSSGRVCKRFWLHDRKDKRKYFFVLLDKIRGQTRFKENTATIPRQRHQKCLFVFLNAYRKNPQAHIITVATFHPKVFRVSYFPQGMEVFF